MLLDTRCNIRITTTRRRRAACSGTRSSTCPPRRRIVSIAKKASSRQRLSRTARRSRSRKSARRPPHLHPLPRRTRIRTRLLRRCCRCHRPQWSRRTCRRRLLGSSRRTPRWAPAPSLAPARARLRVGRRRHWERSASGQSMSLPALVAPTRTPILSHSPMATGTAAARSPELSSAVAAAAGSAHHTPLLPPLGRMGSPRVGVGVAAAAIGLDIGSSPSKVAIHDIAASLAKSAAEVGMICLRRLMICLLNRAFAYKE